MWQGGGGSEDGESEEEEETEEEDDDICDRFEQKQPYGRVSFLSGSVQSAKALIKNTPTHLVAFARSGHIYT